MDREILFRAKLKDWKTNPEHNRWVEGFYLKRKETTYCFAEDYEKYPVKTLHFIAEECMTDWGLPNGFRLYEIDPDTLCQYTEMNDKENHKIWENDIIEEFNSSGDAWNLSQIVFSDHSLNLGWCVKGIKTLHEYNRRLFEVGFGKNNANKCVVIGNIFDNPDLLEYS